METAYQTFFNSIQKFCPAIGELELNAIKAGLTFSNLQAKHFYIQAGSVQHEIGFVCSGLLRAFYIDSKGNEITVNFIREGNYATHYTAFKKQKPSKYYFQCLEPTLIVNLPREHFINCCEKYPLIERYYRLMIEEVFEQQQQRMEGFLFDNAEKRYLDFIKKNPDLFQRVSLSYLCSYLGIERQTLTRIRKKLAQQSF